MRFKSKKQRVKSFSRNHSNKRAGAEKLHQPFCFQYYLCFYPRSSLLFYMIGNQINTAASHNACDKMMAVNRSGKRR